MGYYRVVTSTPALVRLEHEPAPNDPTAHAIEYTGDLPTWVTSACPQGALVVLSYGFTRAPEVVPPETPAGPNMEVDPGAPVAAQGLPSHPEPEPTHPMGVPTTTSLA